MNEKKFKQRCWKLIEKVRKDFPKLKNLPIKFKVEKLKRGGMRATRLYGGWLIIIDPEKYADAKDKEIVGGLAHEFCHFEDYLKKRWIRYFFRYIRYRLSNKFRKKTETKVDKRTIEKGYGKELAANRAYAIKKYMKNIEGMRKCYLSPDEIKHYMKKFKK